MKDFVNGSIFYRKQASETGLSCKIELPTEAGRVRAGAMYAQFEVHAFYKMSI